MKRHRSIFLWLLLVAMTGLGHAQSASTEAVTLRAGSAVIADLKGEVSVSSAQSTTQPAQRGQVLPAESSVETGKGSLLLSLQDGSQVLVKPHSRVVLKEPSQSQGNYLQLFLGSVIAKIEKRLGAAPPFRMGTPTAVITVRGTRFLVEVTKKNKTVVEVYDGLVEVIGLLAPGQPILLQPGYYTQIESDRPPQNPRRMPQGSGGDSGGEGEGGSRTQRGAASAGENEKNSPHASRGNEQENERQSRPSSQGPPH
jgi:hypothetical protein